MAVDATGKVGSRSGVLDDAVRVTTTDAKAGAGAKAGNGGAASKSQEQGGSAVIDKVDLRLAKTIQETLDPVTMSAERQEKIAKLKEMIAAGNYKVSSEAIAQSVSQELAQEIYFGKSAGNETGSLLDVLGESKE
ncbi:MAG: flagellar biosynthesis anti-sigma factor FlgM [Proteobacteria bacterium]|nr:flagellar biosynthesis anti-sigma factor FlgM [Pseudomonadota bacterium]